MNPLQLSPNEQRTRALAIGATLGLLWLLRALPVDGLPRWLPLQTSCGAFTGLPCIFCGGTRALHYLLNGNYSRALYFNWLAFPLLAFAILLVFLFGAELIFRRRLGIRLPRPRLTRKNMAGALAALLCLWGLQVYLAVSQHKHELLNPAGPLYSLVVR